MPLPGRVHFRADLGLPRAGAPPGRSGGPRLRPGRAPALGAAGRRPSTVDQEL